MSERSAALSSVMSSARSPSRLSPSGGRSQSGSPPSPSKREAERASSWVSVGSKLVLTVLDEHLELQKRLSEKESHRQKVLSKQAYEEDLKASKRAREKYQWRKRMQERELAVRLEREFREVERKVQLEEWKQSVAKAQKNQKARIHKGSGDASRQAEETETSMFRASINHFPARHGSTASIRPESP